MKRLLLLLPAAGCFVAAGLALPGHAAEGPGSGFFGYTLTGSSQALQMTEDQPSANSHPESEVDVPHSQVSLTTGPVGYALSSIAWPGALVGNAGSLVLLVQPSAPREVTVLNDPVRAEARTGSPQTSSSFDTIPGTHLEASATPGLTKAAAVTNGGAAGTTVGFGETSSSSVATLETASARVTADSTAKDLSVADGVVRIGSVVSHAEGTTDGVTASAKGSTSVHDMTVAGVPVTVDENGVHVAGSGTAFDPTATATVNSALKAIGMTIALSQPTQAKDGGTVSYDAGSLTMYWVPPGSVNTFTASFGGARVVAGASRSSTFTQPSSPPIDLGGTTGGTTGGPATDPSTGGSVPVVEPPSATTGGTGPAPVVPEAPQATALEPVASGTPAPAWSVLLTVVGALLALGGVWRVPGLVLVEPAPHACPLERSPLEEES